MNWLSQALCAELVRTGDADARWWHATGDELRLAKIVCAACPVQRPCRDTARQNNETGLWGGETDRERYGRPWQPKDGPDPALDDTPAPPRCGTHANYGYGCRCEPCTKAYRRVERKRRRHDSNVERLRRSIGRAT